ncbi:tetratricopeptide repeat protein [Desemzia sp. RIT804]|uniref:tetratricopeptide repeat protein n=1 Tax=Desemzia sp. RIT 804 TaxID=2810209 RepID=UPI00194F5668|nr:tetratricopeptide repeat protein [Desemzia sp. RIT 804]MBM6613584.1 tetratricopeptide repeat protein [Desemzia sp. RIT 804]
MDLNQEALLLWNKGRANEAVATLFKAIDEKPEQAEAYYNLINVLISAQKFSDAKVVLETAVEKFTEEESFLYAYGNWHYQQGQYKEALIHYLNVFQHQDSLFRGEAAAMIGQCYMALQQPKLALAYLLEAEINHPIDTTILLMIGNGLLQTKSFVDAESYFNKVIVLDQENAEAWFKKGLAKRALRHDPEEVKQCLQKAKQLDSERFLTYVKQLKEIEEE